MKTISIMIPTYNEEENISDVYDRVTAVMQEKLSGYNYEIVFIDNCSTDQTKSIIEKYAKKNSQVKAIFNARNFGYNRSIYYGLTEMTGDAVMLIHADSQNPPELIPDFVEKWENGAKVIIGVKNKSKENAFIYFCRGIYYKIMKKVSSVEQIEHFTDFELLDKNFIQVLREIKDPVPYLRGIISEFGFNLERIHYTQDKRQKGKSWANFFDLYDFAMLGITSYSKVFMRMATFIGTISGVISFIIAIVILIQKLINWENFQLGIASITVGVFLLGSIQLIFIGILGEYILSINARVINRPLVIEEKRINFDNEIENNNE